MSNTVWRPVVSTGREDVLVEGFPPYLREATFRWVFRVVCSGNELANLSIFIDFQNALRKNLGFWDGDYLYWGSGVAPRLREFDNDTYINFLDYLLGCEGPSCSRPHPLEQILSDGGSIWTVQRQGKGFRLVQRVPDGVRDAIGEVLDASDIASQKLQEAWRDAYGVNPRPSVAYSNAVIAVETAALSVISVRNSDPTLANLFSILEADKPKWRLIFRESDKAPGAKSLAAMLRTLWRGHESRHGRPDYADAKVEEARAAVMLAATLVQWFNSDVVRPVEPSLGSSAYS